MLTKVYGSAVFGVDSSMITIEVNVDKGIGYHLVGLPDNAIRESNYRIAAALQNNGFKIPGKKLILNMSPADMRKEGSAYDLTLAMGILVATGQIKETNLLENYIIMGELSLDGNLQPIRGHTVSKFGSRGLVRLTVFYNTSKSKIYSRSINFFCRRKPV